MSPAIEEALVRAPRSLLVRQTPERLLRAALLDWAVIACAWTALALGPSLLGPVVVVVIAGRLHALGVLLHDLVHMPDQPRGAVAHLVEALCGYPVGSTARAMAYHHVRHHGHSGSDLDPYFSRAAVGRPFVRFLLELRLGLMVPFWTIRGPIGIAAVFIPALRNFYGRVFLRDVTGADLRGDRAVLACARAEFAQVTVHVLAFGAALALVGPGAVLVGYALPALVAGLFCGARDALDHPTTTDHASSREVLETTRDHDLGIVGALLLAPHHVGHHIVHHLHPDVAHDALPRLRGWYLEQLGSEYPPPGALVS
jgi:fatty acid desaturase